MPDALLAAAVREAYAQAETALIHAIALEHPTYAGALYCAQWHEALTLTDETGAAQEYLPIPFRFSLPEVGESGAAELRVEVDNVPLDVMRYLDAVAGAAGTLSLTYRMWLASRPQAPAWGPLALTVVEASVSAGTVSLRASAADIANRAFPGEDYRPERFPSLVA